MEILKRLDQLPGWTHQAKFLAIPGHRGNTAHQVYLIAPSRHEVGEQMAVRSPPLGAIAHGLPVQPLGFKDRPMRHAARKARRLAPKQHLAHLGPDAIGTDDDVGFTSRAVLKHEADLCARRLQANQAVSEGDRTGLESACEHSVQVAPVYVDVGSAETLLARRV